VNEVLIHAAVSPGDYRAFGALVGEYVAWCRSRYSHDEWFVDEVFGHQDLERELQALPAIYGPPGGKTLLGRLDGEVCGGGAYRRMQDGSCEMKRLYVPDRFKGLGIGRRLSDALIRSARIEGYPLMRLDTASRLTEAISLYRKLGFRDCQPHRPYPPALSAHLVFMELPLARAAAIHSGGG
jgi:ribosomal protein S18 acetylase RimI-like enzyme